MSNQARYAVYIAPAPETALWTFGSRILGYDAVTGCETKAHEIHGLEAGSLGRMTARARTYGFHATLKAPFRLKSAYEEKDLHASLELLACDVNSFSLGRLSPAVLSSSDQTGFVALTPVEPSSELSRLEWRTVAELDDYRSPLTQSEIEKRAPDTLTERQRFYLQRYGYPFVMEDYRFHMTLTDRIANPEAVAGQIARELASTAGASHLDVTDLVLFRQDHPSANFRIVKRFALLQDGVAKKLAG